MADKTLNTRIKLKSDSYSNWMSCTETLLEGEVAVCFVPQSTTADGVVRPPATLFKVGDGEKTFAQLPWVESVAADVYEWAKTQHLEWSNVNQSHVTSGLSGYINTLASGVDTDTKMTLETYYPDINVAGMSFYSTDKNGGNKIEEGHFEIEQSTENGCFIVRTSDKDGTHQEINIPICGLDSAAFTKVEAFDAVGTAEALVNGLNSSDTVATGKKISGITETAGVVTITTTDITSADIPNLNASKITDGTIAFARLPSGPIDSSADVIVKASAIKTYVDQKTAEIHPFDYEVVTTLPTASASTMYKVYLVQATGTETQNYYKEYITIDKGATMTPRYIWELIGDTRIDLSSYVKQLNLTNTAGATSQLTVPTGGNNTITIPVSSIHAARSLTNVTNQFINGLTFDSYGHVTAVTTGEATTYSLSDSVTNNTLTVTLSGGDGTTSSVAIQGSSLISLSSSAGKTVITGPVTDGTYNASSNKVATVSTVTNAITALSGTAGSGTGSADAVTVLTKVTETAGKIDAVATGKSESVQLNGIAKTGNIKYLQNNASTECVILDCGSATRLWTVTQV